MKRTLRTILSVLLLGLATATYVAAQLTSADIDELRERGKKEGWTFAVGENAATKHKLSDLCGTVEPSNGQGAGRVDQSFVNVQAVGLPASFDWRIQTGLPPVRNQGGCGSCWAFSTVGALECAIYVKDGIIDQNLSEQWLVSCNPYGWSCSGGYFAHDMHTRNGASDSCGGNGAVPESAFPYQAANATCACPYPHTYQLESWAYIAGSSTTPTVDAIKQAIYTYGPISVAVYADSAFQAYAGGVFNACYTGNSINHAVVLVGWDDSQGCWIMRNSWGSNWGESGYMRIAYNCSKIGYGANYVVYAGSSWVNPLTGLSSSGLQGGPFTPVSATYTLSNTGTGSYTWTATATQPWVTVSPVSGALAANSTASVIVTINSAAASLAPGNYTDTVTFANSTGKSTTRSVTLAVNAAVLNPPTNLKATVVNSKQTRSVKLTWQDNANVETKFEIWRATGSGTFALLGQAAANATSYTDATAARGATYSYEVRACNATDCSGDSNIATVKVK